MKIKRCELAGSSTNKLKLLGNDNLLSIISYTRVLSSFFDSFKVGRLPVAYN
jgi:hypothetical protein